MVTSNTPASVAIPPATSIPVGRPPNAAMDHSHVTTGVSVSRMVRKLMSRRRSAR
jgi:hypothetical protein